MCYLSSMIAKEYRPGGESITIDDLLDEKSVNGDYSFTDLCETVEAVYRSTHPTRQPVDRYRLHVGEIVYWDDEQYAIPFRVTSISKKGLIRIKGIGAPIRYWITRENENEFYEFSD